MKSLSKYTISFLSLMLLSFLPQTVFAANLVPNPDLQSETASAPTSWSPSFMPSGATSLYPVEGPSGAGDKALRVEFTSYAGGDAKWVHAPFTAEVGELYAFADMYRSTQNSHIVAVITYPDSSVRYLTIMTLPSTSGEWKSTQQQFTIEASQTAPAGPVSVSMMHVLDGIGFLETDNYHVEKIADASANVFSEGVISLTFDDGWASQYDIGLPILTSANLPASFYVMNQSTAQASVDYFVTQIGNISSIVNANSVQWFEIYLDPTSLSFRFVDTYTATNDSFIEFGYTNASGTPETQTFGPYSAGTDKKVAINLTLTPRQSGTPLTIRHYSIDPITVSAPSLFNYSLGFMTLEQILSLQSFGYEIGGHTRNHCNLLAIYNDSNSAIDANVCAFPLANTTPAFQVDQADLRSALGSAFNTFAYPNGANNESIKTQVGSAGFIAARTVDLGYNTKISDKYALKVQIVDASTTLPMVESWINTALLNKTWLILVFHQISDLNVINTLGAKGATTPEMFQSIATFLSGKNVKTVREIIPQMSSVIETPDLLPPVVTLLGPVSMDVAVGSSFVEPGYTVTDNLDSSVDVVVSGIVNTAATGTYQITYNATDNAGNHALEKVRTINVTELPVVNHVPSITLLGSNPVTLTVGNTYTESGATSTDLEDGNLTSQIVMTGSVNTGVAGTYTIVYTVTDSGALSASTTRTVTVNPAPVVTSGGGGGGGGGSSYVYTSFAINGGALEATSSQVTLTLSASGLPQMWLSNDATFSTGGWMSVQSPYTWTLSTGTGTKTVYARFGSASSTYATNQDSILVTATSLPAPLPLVTPTSTSGVVLGASTTCTDLLMKNLRYGNRGAEVKTLQTFLNTTQGETLPLTGYFGSMTREAVKRFQKKYAAQILTPIGLSAPTGIVGNATRTVINSLACGTN